MNTFNPARPQRVLRAVMASALLLVLAACAHTPRHLDDPAQGSGDMMLQLGTAEAGSLVELPAGNALGLATVVPGPYYTAASLRQCRRLKAGDGSGLPRVLCRSEQGGYYLQRSLQTGHAASATPAETADPAPAESTDSSLVSLDDLDTEEAGAPGSQGEALQQFRLRDGETLWSFSRRVTGSGSHWQRIADVNGIDDATAIAAGSELQVPAELVQAGD